MASKKALTDEELFAQFEDIPSASPSQPPPSTRPPKAAKPAPSTTTAAPAAAAPPTAADDDDPLAELSALAAARPASRPGTPRLSSSTTSGNGGSRKAEHTPASSGPPSGRTSEDRARAAPSTAATAAAAATNPGARKSTESARSYHQPFTPQVGDSPEEESEQASSSRSAGAPAAAGGGGGWWGSVFNVASAAVKQAEAAVKEIRGNEEVMKYAEQLRNVNVESLKQYGGNVRSLALPTFHSLIQTIAPPISAHERLQIHTTHDILGYPSLDPLIYAVFARVMSQVEGGDLLVIQRGSESRARDRSTSDVGYRGGVLGGPSGWTDGPWWRDTGSKRDLGSVSGLVEGTKLARASAEAYSNDFFASRGGLEEAAKHATQVLSESNPVRSSDIFLALQAITQPEAKDLFAAGSTNADQGSGAIEQPAAEDEQTTAFAIFLYDPIHSLSFSALSQSFPAKWSAWLDESSDAADGLPDSVREIVEAGGIDPREWVAEWIEEVLTLAIGVVAQRYVAKRMGVGEGGIGRGKARARLEEDGSAGEAARAGII
ncbi:hypothetical protein MBLNU459_g6416t1 [Dothideomycetes sp. NU459]